MNIGIDIDDTINNLAQIIGVYAKKYNEENNIDYKIRLNCWSWEKACGWNEYHIKKFMGEYMEEAFLKATPKDDAANVIEKLHLDGNKIIIITSRSDQRINNPYQISEKWLKRNNIYYDKLIINGEEKAKQCIENNIDIFIDDHIDFCNDIQKNTKTRILMFDSPYNQECTKYTRVNTWKEVYEKIKEI